MLFIEIAGLIAFSISGALAAFKKDLDIVGYVAVGVVTGIGGGTLRDLILNRTVFWIGDPYLYSLNICIATAVVTYFFGRFIENRKNIVNWFDALGLALFAIQGYSIAFQMHGNFEIALIMGVVTGVGGGLMRDICLNRQPFIFRGELYASAVAAGLLVYYLSDSIALSFATSFTLRAGAIKFGWRLK